MEQCLLASMSWILDLAFFAALVVGMAIGAQRGFVRGIFKLAGWLFALIVAFFFCVSFSNLLEQSFGMTTAIANGLAERFAGKEGYDVGISAGVAGAEIGTVLEELGIGGLAKLIIVKGFANVETVMAGTTAAQMLGASLAKWISIVISFLILALVIRLAVWLVSNLFSGLIDKIKPLRVVDKFLGAILGLAKAALLIFILLLVCNWISLDAVNGFIASSKVVGGIYQSEWFAAATSYALSGQWFDDYLSQFLL